MPRVNKKTTSSGKKKTTLAGILSVSPGLAEEIRNKSVTPIFSEHMSRIPRSDYQVYYAVKYWHNPNPDDSRTRPRFERKEDFRWKFICIDGNKKTHIEKGDSECKCVGLKLDLGLGYAIKEHMEIEKVVNYMQKLKEAGVLADDNLYVVRVMTDFYPIASGKVEVLRGLGSVKTTKRKTK